MPTRWSRFFIFLALFIAAALILNTPFFRHSPPLTFLRTSVLTLLYPLQTFFHRSDNPVPVQELAAAKIRLGLYDALSQDNQRLRELLNFKERSTFRYTLIPAEVLGRSSGWQETLVIDKGGRDGIKPAMGVVSPGGVVGQIAEVAIASARVRLITDSESAVSGRDSFTGAVGVVTGGMPIAFRYVSGGAIVNPLDPIVTSGLGVIFPRGFTVGRVSRVSKTPADLFQKIEVVPAVDSTTLEAVFVIKY